MRLNLFVFFAFISLNVFAQNCQTATQLTSLEVNNAKVWLSGAGTYAFHNQLNEPALQIPKGSGVGAVFASAFWIGGLDSGGNLHVAAQTYRQSGNDFWPGPIDTNGVISQSTCTAYDKFWRVTTDDLFLFESRWSTNSGVLTEQQVPENILRWPAFGSPFVLDFNGIPLVVSQALAPFVDVDGNGVYNPIYGDYPKFKGDETVFWVANDIGNIHGETMASEIGIEIQCQAYAYHTSDDLDNVVFFYTKIISKNNTPLHDVYLGHFVDPDLGCFNNDHLGCDTAQSLAIVYNGTPTDPDCAGLGYGNEPPIAASQILKGPYAVLNNLIDDDRDGLVDEGTDGVDNNNNNVVDEKEEQERIDRMTSFLYYNGDFSVTGNPMDSLDYYYFMQPKWKDGTPVTNDQCNGYGGSLPTSFMFPSDPSKSPFPNYWSECSCGNSPADRRFIQGVGPFDLSLGDEHEFLFAMLYKEVPGGFTCGVSYDTTIIPMAYLVKGFVDTASYNVIDVPIGISEFVNSGKFNVYPNPVNETFTIEFENTKEIEQITIVNIDGKQFDLTVDFYNNKTSIESSTLNAGVYIIQITTPKGIYTSRFAKL